MTLLIGIVGAFLVLACFIAIETNKLDTHSPWYDAGNIVGSLLLMVYSYRLAAWPFLVLNIVWGLVALRDLLHTLAARRKNR